MNEIRETLLFFLPDLPWPKLFHLEKESKEESFGFLVDYDNKKQNFIVCTVTKDSIAARAGMSTKSQIVEVHILF